MIFYKDSLKAVWDDGLIRQYPARHGRWRNNGKELESVGDGMNMLDFACRQLSVVFDAPCNYNDICDYMHERDEYFCPNCDKWAVWQCWKKYFELKYDDIYGK